MVNPYCAKSTDYLQGVKRHCKRVAPQLQVTRRARNSLHSREAACFVILRKRFGYTTQAIAAVFNRSTSTVHRILKWNADFAFLHLHDLRKLPTHIKLLSAIRQRLTLEKYLMQWVEWLNSEEGKPP